MATEDPNPATAPPGQEKEISKEIPVIPPEDGRLLRGNVSSSFRFLRRKRGENRPTWGQENQVELPQPKLHQQPQVQSSQQQQANFSTVFETACDRTKCSVCGKLPFQYRERLIQTVIWEGAGMPPPANLLCQPAPGPASIALHAPTSATPQDCRRQSTDRTLQRATQQQQQRQRELLQQQQAMWDLAELGLFDFAPKIVMDRHPQVERAVASRMASVAERQIRQINRDLARAGLSVQNRHPYSSSSSSCGSSRAGSTASHQQRRHSRHPSQCGSVTTVATGGSSTRSRETDTLCTDQRKSSISTESTTSWTQPRIVAPFVKTEIEAGVWLGSGGFSCVFEVISFQPDEEVAVNAVQQAARSFMAKHAQRQCNTQVAKNRKQKVSARSVDSSQVTEARYAMKHLRYGLADDMKGSRFEEAAVDLVREGCVLAGLDHPNIVRIHGWSYHGAETYRTGYYTDYFLILDKMTETLEWRIWRWRQSFKKYKSRLAWPWARNKFLYKMQRVWIERIRAALDVAHGLAYLHKHGLMHRDIKPSNVGFDVRGDIRIFDFGLSRLVPRDDDGTEEFDPASKNAYEMSRVGTKYYMAPEVRKKEPYNVSADVYSYGVLLWEILTLSNPRDAVKKIQPSKEDVDHGERWLPLCPCWPIEVGQILKGCLASDPHVRPTMEDVVIGLSRHLKKEEERQYDTFGSSGEILAEESDEYGSFVARRRSTFRLDLSGIDFSEFNDSCTTSYCSDSNFFFSGSVVSNTSAAHSRCSSQFSQKEG